jgi:transcription elongation factor Elf1
MISPFPKKKKVSQEVAKVSLDTTNNCPVCGVQLTPLFVNLKNGRVKAGVCIAHRVCLPQVQGG